MLSMLAIAFHTARLGFEAQNAAAFRFLRLAGNVRKTVAAETVADEIASLPTAARRKVASDRGRRPKFNKKPHKTRAPASKRRRSK